jgi:hypothetical protein
LKGGRIHPYTDGDNEYMGPSRVWLKDQDVPGLAMTRSFGDEIASTVGITALPGKYYLIQKYSNGN